MSKQLWLPIFQWAVANKQEDPCEKVLPLRLWNPLRLHSQVSLHVLAWHIWPTTNPNRRGRRHGVSRAQHLHPTSRPWALYAVCNMPCTRGNCQRITSIFSVSSPILRSILNSAWTSSTRNRVLASAACSLTSAKSSSLACINASSMGEFCPFSSFTQTPFAINSGKNWRNPGSKLARRCWSAWCRSTFTTTANLSLTKPRWGAKTSAKRINHVFNAPATCPATCPCDADWEPSATGVLLVCRLSYSFRHVFDLLLASKNKGTSSAWASRCALSTMICNFFYFLLLLVYITSSSCCSMRIHVLLSSLTPLIEPNIALGIKYRISHSICYSCRLSIWPFALANSFYTFALAYVLTFYSGICFGILFWHFIWHFFWHSILAFDLAFDLAYVLVFYSGNDLTFYSNIWFGIFWHMFWHSILTFDLAYVLAFDQYICSAICFDILFWQCFDILFWHMNLTFYSDIWSGIVSDICFGILSGHMFLTFYSGSDLTFYSDICFDILFWHLIWHFYLTYVFWHSFLAFDLAFDLAYVLAFYSGNDLTFYSDIWSDILSDICFWHSILTFDLALYLTYVLAFYSDNFSWRSSILAKSPARDTQLFLALFYSGKKSGEGHSTSPGVVLFWQKVRRGTLNFSWRYSILATSPGEGHSTFPGVILFWQQVRRGTLNFSWRYSILATSPARDTTRRDAAYAPQRDAD